MERRLSPESSAEPGRYRTSRTEYARGIMDAFNDPAVKDVVVMSSSQVAKTTILENVVGYFVHHDPAPMMVIQPTLEMAEAFSKDRLAPMIRDTPALRSRVEEAGSRKGGNTLLHKKFPGGHLTISGSNSPSSLASRPIRVLLCDEVDRYDVSAGTEGDPSMIDPRSLSVAPRESTRITVPEIARRLHVGVQSVYELLESGEIPSLRLGKRWLISRYAYLEWEKRFGTAKSPEPPFPVQLCQ